MRDGDFARVSSFFTDSFQFGVHASDGPKSKVWEVAAEQKYLPYLRAENCKGNNIFMRPLIEASKFFLLVDDLNKTQVTAHINQPGRMVVETSPLNYQVWVRSANPLDDPIKKVLLVEFGSDPGAAPNKRWGRAVGFTNRKPKHKGVDGLYPFAKLVYFDCSSVVLNVPEQTPEMENVGLFGTPNGTPARGERCRSDFDTGDPSQTDFRYCMSLIRQGLSDSEIYDRILSERSDWQHHTGVNRDKYLKRTIVKARLWTKA